MTASLIVHGGAWNWSDSLDAQKHDALKAALQQGWQHLQAGHSAIDAVEAAIIVLEDHPLFDAGTGSHLNAEGIVELDAIIVDGNTRDFGAVAGLTRIKNPISLARRVMEDSPHNFFVATGAESLAQQLGIPLIPNVTLVTDYELNAYRKAEYDGGHDTVGAIAVDQHGRIAAGTSTGGTPRKLPGRVGDAPLFGAGAYVDPLLGGAGATGKGENSMRVLLSKYTVDLLQNGQTSQEAAEAAMRYIDARFEDSMVGVILMDQHGRPGAAHTTPKMAYGWVDEKGQVHTRMRAGVS